MQVIVGGLKARVKNALKALPMLWFDPPGTPRSSAPRQHRAPSPTQKLVSRRLKDGVPAAALPTESTCQTAQGGGKRRWFRLRYPNRHSPCPPAQSCRFRRQPIRRQGCAFQTHHAAPSSRFSHCSGAQNFCSGSRFSARDRHRPPKPSLVYCTSCSLMTLSSFARILRRASNTASAASKVVMQGTA